MLEKPIYFSPRFQAKLQKLGIKTVGDLLFHFPSRYEDFSKIIKIKDVKLNEECCVKGKILEIKNIRTFKKRMFLTQAVVGDETGAIKVVWFNQPYLVKVLKKGEMVCLAGKNVISKSGIYLSNPAYEKIGEKELIHTARLVPVYPETEGLSSRWLRYILRPLLLKFKDKIPEPLPQIVLKKYQFLPLREALWQIHFPASLKLAQKAQERFSFEEIFLIELLVLREKSKFRQVKAPAIPLNLDLVRKFVRALPFQLTNPQRKSAWQILKDIQKSHPMNRLLQGDVGSGKTVVATIAALVCTKNGFQAAFMAPTEILAKQHFQVVFNLLKDYKLSIALLTGKEDKIFAKKLENTILEISRQKLLEKARNGEIDILIGTHALIQDKVKFENLGLVVVDEQHRFGVEQRAKLIARKNLKQTSEILIPHLLSMTATPIPRTLSLTIYGDLDLSLIDELPKGRKKIITKVVAPKERAKIYDFVRQEVMLDRRVFVICPRIEPGDISKREKARKTEEEILSWAEAKAVKQEYEKLSKEIFPDLKVGMLHGKFSPKEKERTMKDFKLGKIQILVSTSVVEVGIDVPSATVMLIEGAERFGLAQLHQLRGRVGRSDLQSYCFLFTDSPSRKTRMRLRALELYESGFKLAEKDLEIRGPGDFLGQRQWGIADLTMTALKDINLVMKAREMALEILQEDPYLKKYSLLKERVEKFRKKAHLE